MGTSNWQNISYVVELIRAINPTRILDFGIGFGRWGILCREFLEVWDEGNYTGKWNRQIDGVEVFPDYIKSYHSYFYDNIYKEEGYKWIKNCKENYNLIIFGDVLEHFEKSIALDIIRISLSKSDYLLINIPIGKYWEQSNINENIYEEHKSTWNVKDFKEYGNKTIKTFRDYVGRKYFVVLIANKPININNLLKKRYGKYYNIRNILIYHLGLKAIAGYGRK
ncbi:MAG: class I SAM-dependent methyltransferase [Ignavibacteria bacterium]